MARVKSENAARKELVKGMTKALKAMQSDVLIETGWASEAVLNAKIGSKHDWFFDLKNQVVDSCEEFASLWLKKLQEQAKTKKTCADLLERFNRLPAFREYCILYIQRSLAIHFKELSRTRPTVDESTLWIGNNNAEYGILVTPRFNKAQWENDKSHIRKVPFNYWTIGHILKTGLLIPGKDDRISFSNVSEYITFFKNVLVRSSGSIHENNIAECYSEFVLSQKKPKDVPLLIPQFRYNGLDKAHTHRLDFLVINPFNLKKTGFELSPWSSHGTLKNTKNRLVKDVNSEAEDNAEKQASRIRDFFKKYDITTLTYTKNLSNYAEIFECDIKPLLLAEEPKLKISFETKLKYRL